MSKKVYVHLELKDSSLPATTFVVEVSEDSTIERILENFTTQLSTKTSSNYDKESVIFMNEHGKVLSKVKNLSVNDLINDLEGSRDIFVFSAPKSIVYSPSACQPSTKLPIDQQKSGSAKKPTSNTVQAVSASASSSPTVPKAETKSDTATNIVKSENTLAMTNEVLEAHRKLEEYMRKRQYQLCKPLADVLIEHNCDRSFAHNCLALIAIENGNLDESIRQCKNAIQADRTNPNSYYIMGKALIQKGQFEESADICDKGVKVWKARAAVTPIKDRDEHLCLDMIALQAEAMFADGDHNDAANLLNSLMGNPLCDRNLNILVTYASFALQYRKLEEAIVAFLKSIALKTPDPRVTKLAVDILTTREGFQEFIRQFPPATPESAEVYAFLGTLVKELSAMDTSVVLYQIAMRLQPENPSYVLNLVHVLEVKQSLDEALELLRTFYGKNSSMGFRQQQSSNAVALNTACARMLEAMQPPSSSSGRRCQITWVQESPLNQNRGFAFVEQVDDVHTTIDTPASHGSGGINVPSVGSSSSTSAVGSSSATAMSRSTSTGSSDVGDDEEEESAPTTSSVTNASTDGVVTSVISPYDDPDHRMYTFVTRELDLIALYATSVKVFYLKGLLSHLPMMVTLMERIRSMSQTPLHETLVRNELAYYQDIVQILSVRTHAAVYGLPDVSFALNDPLKSNKPEWVAARQRPIYLCGDSHCLSGGWSILKVHSLPRLVIPKLVTGVKCWHLRPESKFYPKENFLQTIASIPIGSEVIFVLGEIDCREGLLAALERGQYGSLEEGMKHTIGIFVKMLKDLKKSRKFRVRSKRQIVAFQEKLCNVFVL